MGFFPVDGETLRYLRLTGRTEDEVQLVERYYKEQGLFRTDDARPVYTKTSVKLDLSTVEPSLAGPKRPQDRVPLSRVKQSFQASALTAPIAERGFALDEKALARVGKVRQPTATATEMQPRRRRHRLDHKLHQHQQPIGDDGRGPPRQGGRRARPASQSPTSKPAWVPARASSPTILRRPA